MDEMDRITREELFIKMADMMSERGSCRRGKVGCIITLDNRIVSSGYNGPLSTDKPCNELNCNLEEGCKRAIHAEANAIFFAASRGISLKGGTLYCKWSPCQKCAEAIVQSKITTVVFSQVYRDTDPIDFLALNGVKPILHIP